ncbi:MAG: hypothetical protein P4M11_14660 [Candidatus Pacebacteria bacterium]|nr:hypothetical protein [Candidatus Paceibacterota bacterium]
MKYEESILFPFVKRTKEQLFYFNTIFGILAILHVFLIHLHVPSHHAKSGRSRSM